MSIRTTHRALLSRLLTDDEPDDLAVRQGQFSIVAIGSDRVVCLARTRAAAARAVVHGDLGAENVLWEWTHGRTSPEYSTGTMSPSATRRSGSARPGTAASFHPETGFLASEAVRLSQVVAVSTNVVTVAMSTAVSGVVAVSKRPVTAELRP